jgi:hypothetical protein
VWLSPQTNVVPGSVKPGRIAAKCVELLRAFRIGDRQDAAGGVLASGRRQVVIGHGERQIGTADLTPCDAETFERLRAGDFVDEVAVYIDQAGAVVTAFDDVRRPDLFVQRLRISHDGRALTESCAGAKPRRNYLSVSHVKRRSISHYFAVMNGSQFT